jgi:hypothetical protein
VANVKVYGEPVTAVGSVAGLVKSRAGVTVSVKLRVPVAPTESVACTVKLEVPPLGAPWIRPETSRTNPSGNAPPVIDHRYVPLPPLAVSTNV